MATTNVSLYILLKKKKKNVSFYKFLCQLMNNDIESQLGLRLWIIFCWIGIADPRPKMLPIISLMSHSLLPKYPLLERAVII